MGLAPGGRTSHEYYETAHGKSESDRLGGAVKGAWLRGVARETWDSNPTTMEEVADLIRRNLPGKGGEMMVVVLPPMERPKEDGEEILVKGIKKLHSLVRTKDGSILGLPFTCKTCLLQQVYIPHFTGCHTSHNHTDHLAGNLQWLLPGMTITLRKGISLTTRILRMLSLVMKKSFPLAPSSGPGVSLLLSITITTHNTQHHL